MTMDYLSQQDPADVRNIVLKLEQRIAALERSVVDVNSLDEITPSAGELELIAHDVNANLTFGVDPNTGNVYSRGDMMNLLNWWQSLGQPASPGAVISAMVYWASQNAIYIGGTFTQIGGVAASNIAKYDLATKTFSALGSGLNNTVYALCVDTVNNILYIGGTFTDAGGDANADKFCKWNGSAFSACGTAFAGVAGDVYALCLAGNKLNIGGTFINVSDANGDYLVRFNVSSGLYVTYTTPLNGSVNALIYDGSNYFYVGGTFTDAGGDTNADKLCKLSGTTFSAVGTAFSGCAGTVTGLAIDANGNLYIAGNFSNVGDANGDGIVMWNGSAYSSLGSGFGGSGCLDVAVIGSYVYVSLASGTTHFAWRWTGSAWETFGNGLFSGVWRIVGDADGNVYYGGNFYTDANKQLAMSVFARYGYASLKEVLDYLLVNLNLSSTILFSAPNVAIASNATRYSTFGYPAIDIVTETDISFIVPGPSTQIRYFRNFKVKTRTAQPAGAAMTVTLRVNEADSAISVQIPISGAAGVYGDATNIVAVSGGSRITYKHVNGVTGFVSAVISTMSIEML